jgi:hypothetical protein
VNCAPDKVLLAMPCGTSSMYTEVVMSVIAVLAGSGGSVRPYWLNGHSNIAGGRSLMAHYFLNNTECDTLFFWDSDIVASLQDFAYMMEGDEQVVIAPYARKEMGRAPVGFGMGFCRIHRSVFDTLNAWTTDEGEEVLGRFYQNDVPPQPIATHFFYTGASPEARWYGEDTGFWHFCARNNITQRLERRTRLGHIGLFKYGYPDQMAVDVHPVRGIEAYPPPTTANAGDLGFDNPEEPEAVEAHLTEFLGG